MSVFCVFLESDMGCRVGGVKLQLGWVVLLLVVDSALLHVCSAGGLNGTSPRGWIELSDNVVPAYAPGEYWEKKWTRSYRQRYFYAHNETRVARARAEAEVARRQGPPLSRALRLGTFPDFEPSESACLLDSADRYLSFIGEDSRSSSVEIEILAVDSCARFRDVFVEFELEREFRLQQWVEPEKRDALIRDDPESVTRSFNVLVQIHAAGEKGFGWYDVTGDGVYFPATGQMHLVGCIRSYQMRSDIKLYPRMAEDLMTAPSEAMNLPYESPPEPPPFSQTSWIDPDKLHEPPLKSSTFDDCAISMMVQYPPLNCRWNKDRVLKYTIRSNREKDDPLYFDPMEKSAFNPYLGRRYSNKYWNDAIRLQRRLETGGQIVLLVLGLVCVALQIEHSRHNEESLPFVSLAMLGIQLASHLSQMSIFKDLQIEKYVRGYSGGVMFNITHMWYDRDAEFPFPEEESYKQMYYGVIMWREHVPYQAMAMTAIFMYVWIFHRVGDRRRIMRVRVLKKRPGAKDPPSEWHVMWATLAFFSLLCFLGFFAIRADQHGLVRRALTGMTEFEDRWFADEERRAAGSVPDDASYDPALPPYAVLASPFVPRRFYELSQAHWGFINKLTGLVVSLFLVPQLLGNMQWDVQGRRPLSAWFYIGIPFLQLLPHVFSITKYLQVLPIFRYFDPYLDSEYGMYQNPSVWWAMGVVICSTLQVLAVHFLLSRSQILSSSWHSWARDYATQRVDSLL